MDGEHPQSGVSDLPSATLLRLFQTDPDPTMVLDSGLMVVAANRAAEDLFGPLTGRALPALCRPTARERVTQAADAARDFGEAVLPAPLMTESGATVAVELLFHRDPADRLIVRACVQHLPVCGPGEALDIALEGGYLGVWEWDPEAGVMLGLGGFASCFGLPAGAVRWPRRELFDSIVPEDRSRLHVFGDAGAPDAGEWECQVRVRWADGRIRWLHWRGVFRQDGVQGGGRALGVVVDVSAQRENCAMMRLVSKAMDASRNGMVLADARLDDAPIVYVNPAFERMTGYSASECLGRNCRFLNEGDDDQPGIREIRAALREEREAHAVLRNYRKDGALFWNELHLAPLRDELGRLTHYVGIQTDISEQHRREVDLTFRASHDPLTGLPNRTLYHDRLGQALDRCSRQRTHCAVAFLDLDHFKHLNDSIGHDTGDALLRHVGVMLERCCRATDTVSRYGGDEFAILIPDLGSSHEALPLISRIVDTLAEEVDIQGRRIRPGASVGYAVYPGDGETSESLMRAADIAMYAAKRSGRQTFVAFQPGLTHPVAGRESMADRLRTALDEAQFVLHYQPRVCLASGRVVGIEALLRWQTRDRGLLLPWRFLEAAEDSGLMPELWAWTLREACRQQRLWLDAGLSAVPMAINFGGDRIGDDRIGDQRMSAMVAQALTDSGLPAGLLEIDLPAAAVMDPAVDSPEVLLELDAIGVALNLDNFGYGMADLGKLDRLPLSGLAIAPALLAGAAPRQGDVDAGSTAALLRGMVALAHQLDLRVIVKGVEDDLRREFALASGGNIGQGGWLGRTMPPEAMASLLEPAAANRGLGASRGYTD